MEKNLSYIKSSNNRKGISGFHAVLLHIFPLMPNGSEQISLNWISSQPNISPILMINALLYTLTVFAFGVDLKR